MPSMGIPPVSPKAPSTYSMPLMVTGGMSPGIVEDARTRTMRSSSVVMSLRVNHSGLPSLVRVAPIRKVWREAQKVSKSNGRAWWGPAVRW